MLELNPSGSVDLAFALKKAIKLYGLSMPKIVERLNQGYGLEITVSGLSLEIKRGTIRFQRAFRFCLYVGWPQ